VFVRERPFDHQNEIFDLSFRGIVEGSQKIVSLQGEEQIM
jgi:hypothetical protein